MIEISRQTTAKAGQARNEGSPATRDAKTGSDIIAGLVKGARFQGTVLEREGLFHIIDVNGTPLKTRSENSLPRGAVVKLEVLTPGNPLRVKLLSLLTPSHEQEAKLTRKLFHIRSELSTLSQVFSRSGNMPEQPGLTDSTEAADHTLYRLFKIMFQGSEAAPEKNRAAAALFRKLSSSSDSLLKDIISNPAPADNENSLHNASAGAAPDKTTGTEPRSPAPATMNTAAKKEMPEEKSPAIQRFAPRITRAEEPDTRQEFLPFSAKISISDQDASTGRKFALNLQDKALMQGGDAPSSRKSRMNPGENIQDAAPDKTSLNQTQKNAASSNRDSAGHISSSVISKDSGPRVHGNGAKIPGARDVNRHTHTASTLEGKTESGNTVHGKHGATSHNVDIKPEQQINAQRKTVSSRSLVASSLNTGIDDLPGTATITVDKAAGNQQQIITAGKILLRDLKPKLENSVHTPEAVKYPIMPSKDEDGAPLTMRSRETVPNQQQVTTQHRAGSPKNSQAGTAERPASGPLPEGSIGEARQTHEAHALKFLNALTSHVDSVNQYRQEIHDYIHAPFFMIPVLFEKGQGNGHWSWWEESGNRNTSEGNMQHLVFDLELSHLGRINIHLLRENDTISMHTAAPREILPLLRTGMQELRRNMENIGFKFSVADIFPIEEADPAEFLAPVKAGGASLASSLNIIA